jgi:hypothetical protein
VEGCFEQRGMEGLQGRPRYIHSCCRTIRLDRFCRAKRSLHVSPKRRACSSSPFRTQDSAEVSEAAGGVSSNGIQLADIRCEKEQAQ